MEHFLQNEAISRPSKKAPVTPQLCRAYRLIGGSAGTFLHLFSPGNKIAIITISILTGLK